MQTAAISIEDLTGGDKVALAALEVTSVPDISIIDTKSDAAGEALERYQAEVISLLREVYQTYRSISSASGNLQDISLELLWATEPVQNQPYKAKIRLFVIARVIDQEAQSAENCVSAVIRLCRATLRLQKYDFEDTPYEALAPIIHRIRGESIYALVKEERAIDLRNQLLPYCYAYDRLPSSGSDFSKVINALIEYPHAAVSVQLMPETLTYPETAELDSAAQKLNTLSSGVADQSFGQIAFAHAKKHAEIYQYYADNKAAPLFSFNLLVYADSEAANDIAGALFGQVSTGVNGSAALRSVILSADEADKNRNFFPLPWAIRETLQNKDRNRAIWTSGQFSGALYRLPYIITAEEASEIFRLPIGGPRVSAGLQINKSGKEQKTYSSNIINAGDITVGRLKSSSHGDTIGFSLKDLAKHMLVVGTPGSGKTTFSVSLLDRLWKQHGIPFLVIEPAKNEYRALIQSIPDLQVFTPGKNFISPFVFNPFIPPKNVRLETYKSTLKTAFAAAVSMSTPLDKIFEESINNCYSDFRWLDTYTSDDKGRIFNITDFIKCFQQTFEDIGYTGDARNIGRAGVVRLNSLANLFDNYSSIPIEDILRRPTVIELAAIENSEQKALIISLLLLSILAYVNANYVGEGGLKNVILLEEAHVLLDAGSNGGLSDANPSAIAQGLVKRMLAEIRSYGVGLIIADQSPRKVSTDVVALTDMKVVFRLVESEDKQIIGNSTNMSDTQIQRMSKLKPGEAFLFFNKLEEPEEVVTPDYRLENNISISLSDDSIRQLSSYWKGKEEMLRPYPECGCTPYCSHCCDYDRRILAKEIARRIFVRNFRADTKDFTALEKVISSINSLVRAELNDEPFNRKLVSCVKVHLWRRIKYGTKITLSEQLILNSLKKE